ncbi:hypothetical protein GBA52_002111 [Prunus armeniaca]|nr:hypothetical protein GBA52_002111 [Prunus armeniaca]
MEQTQGASPFKAPYPTISTVRTSPTSPTMRTRGDMPAPNSRSNGMRIDETSRRPPDQLPFNAPHAQPTTFCHITPTQVHPFHNLAPKA